VKNNITNQLSSNVVSTSKKVIRRKWPARKWIVNIDHDLNCAEFNNVDIKRVIRKTLSYVGTNKFKKGTYIISVVFTTDNKIREFNRTYRNKDKPTDVLSFSQLEGETLTLPQGIPVIIGDIIISVDTATIQAKEFNVTIKEELTRLLVHGCLHLFGYDHENVSNEIRLKMEQAEKYLIFKCTW
jgi:probable rRNA maturation factor